MPLWHKIVSTCVHVCLFLTEDNITSGLIGQSAFFETRVRVCVCACRTEVQLPQIQWGFSGISYVRDLWDIYQTCTFIMSSTFLPSHGDAHSQITPLLPHHSFYLMNIHQTAEGDVSLFFFYPSSRSSFPECFLGALELQWHCRSRVGVAETTCRSSLGDFSQSIASVSSQMICALRAFRSGGFLWCFD